MSGVGGAAAEHPTQGASAAGDQVQGDASCLQPLLPRGEAGVVVALHSRPQRPDARVHALPCLHTKGHGRGERISHLHRASLERAALPVVLDFNKSNVKKWSSCSKYANKYKTDIFSGFLVHNTHSSLLLGNTSTPIVVSSEVVCLYSLHFWSLLVIKTIGGNIISERRRPERSVNTQKGARWFSLSVTGTLLLFAVCACLAASKLQVWQILYVLFLSRAEWLLSYFLSDHGSFPE